MAGSGGAAGAAAVVAVTRAASKVLQRIDRRTMPRRRASRPQRRMLPQRVKPQMLKSANPARG